MPRRDILLYLTAIGLVGFTIDGGIYSVVYNLYVLRLGYGPDFVGLLASVSLVAFTVASAPAGVLGSRWGSRRSMLLGLGLMTGTAILMPLAAMVPATAVSAWLLGLYSLQMVGLAFFFVNGPPYLTAVAPPALRERAFSYQVALWSFAAFVGSLLGGFLPGLLAARLGLTLSAPLPYAVPLGVAAMGLAVACVAMFAASDVTLRPSGPKSEAAVAFPLMVIVVLGVVRFLQAGAVGTTIPFFNVYMDSALHTPTVTIGIVTALGRLLAVPTALLAPMLARRWGNANTVTWGSLGLSLAVLPMIFIPDWIAASLGFVGVTSLSSVRYAAFLVYAMDIVPPERRGLLSGVSETSAGVSFAFTAYLGGQMITRLGYPPLFAFGAVMGLVGTALFWPYFQVRREPRPSVEVGEV